MPTAPTPEQALIRLYAKAATQLRRDLKIALEKGNTGTAAYKAAQLQRVTGVLRSLGRKTPGLVHGTVHAPFAAGAHAVDASLPGAARQAFAFNGTNLRAAQVIATNTVTSIDRALQLVGRRVDDAFRTAALEEVGQGVAAGSTRREVSKALKDRLIKDKLVDATTGFVNSRGARLQIDDYVRMVARTTTREAMSAGTQNRLLERGERLITISAHGTTCPICSPYEGNTYAMPGTVDENYETIDRLPPFHPNCLHVATPTAGNADRFLASLGIFAPGERPGTRA